MTARILALLYGPHLDLHKRILDSFRSYVPKTVPITLWLNKVERSTKDRVAEENGRYDVVDSPENVKKYVAMRAMMNRFDISRPDWWIWFDDDSHIVNSHWWDVMSEFIERRHRENICYIGQRWFVHHLPGQWDFISKASWFRGKPAELIKGRPAVNFATGGYWWLRADVQKMLDWPDVRLGHNGGDTLLGVAIHQNGLPFHQCDYGVKINDGKRRGFSEAPAGSTGNIRR